MYAQLEKPKENKSRAIAYSVTQSKSDNRQGFGFVDNRPEVTGQKKLQNMMNHLDSQQKSPIRTTENAITSKATQFKIHVKSGEKYNGVNEDITAPKLIVIANSPEIYFVRTNEDIEKMKNKEDVPVLANKKHLIGERHDASRFTEAVADWGWAVSMLIEEYSKHDKLKNPKKAEKENSKVTDGQYDQDFIYGKAKALEDEAAKDLTLTINGKIFAGKILTFATLFQIPTNFTTTDKAQLKTTCEAAWHKCDPVMDVALTLVDYYRKSTKQWFSLKKHDLIQNTLTGEFLKEIGIGLDNIKEQIDDENNLHLDPVKIQNFLNRANELVPVMQQLIVAYDNKDFNLQQIEAMSEKALIAGPYQSGDIGEFDPLREKYMRNNINRASRPTLIKIGRQHVVHLANDLPANTIAHNDYTDFEVYNTASKVVV